MALSVEYYQDYFCLTPKTKEYKYITSFLKHIELKLRRYGIVFGSSSKTVKFKSSDQDTWFLTGYFQSLTSVKIKQFGGNSETVLTADTDYYTDNHILDPNPIRAITLLRRSICAPSYLEVTGIEGFDAEEPEEVKHAVVDLAGQYLSLYKKNYDTTENGGRVINETQKRNIKVKYSDHEATHILSNKAFEGLISNNEKFQNVIDAYRLC